jgi:DNA-binding protein YbaB
MLDDLKNMKQLAGLFKDLPRMQQQMEEVKARLDDLRVEAETGGGAVRCVATGAMRVVSVEVDPAVLSVLVDTDAEADRAMAGDLIAGAVNAALVKAREAAEREMQGVAAELGLPLPPGGLGGMLG